jgi:sugar O-acyltransferase (sialic acid O-acetyltransferase NeuD family)
MDKVLIGYGGHAREVISQIGINLPCFVDDEFVDENTLPLSKLSFEEYEVMVAIGDPISRKKIVDKLPPNTKYFTFIHPTAQIMDDNIEIGEGSFIGANSIITTNVKIGKHSLLNRGCHIGHDTVIGDYLSMMPNSVISGNVNIGNCFYMGTNSSVREKINICDNVTIGLNSGVVKDINEKGVYVGLPVKKINK